MKVHDININRKYFEPIREGKIKLLIFKKKVIDDINIGDYILASFHNYEVKAKINGFSIKAFSDITEKEARQAGFLTKDFLRDELIIQYKLREEVTLSIVPNIDSELFFLINIETEDEEHQLLSSSIKVNLYKNSSTFYNKKFYNPEYDDKPWGELT